MKPEAEKIVEELAAAETSPAPVRRVAWCARCSRTSVIREREKAGADATVREAQKGGGLCRGCAAIEFRRLVTLKVNAARAAGLELEAVKWLRMQDEEDARLRAGAPIAREYPYDDAPAVKP